MQGNIVFVSNDGSKSIYNTEIGEAYHSKEGAIAESEIVYLKNGFSFFKNSEISILEIGYGTGLNAMMTFRENQHLNNVVNYHGVDKNEITAEDMMLLKSNASLLQIEKDWALFNQAWNLTITIDSRFKLTKHLCSIHDFAPELSFDLVYLDAFSPDKQPDMWSCELLDKIFRWMNPKGILVTYSSKGLVKRGLRDAGFNVKRLPGPPPKRHVIQAVKP